ncbi:MAG TPA: MFS transporter [Sedimentisphaerales bacterium]|nr:MFS transporter [Sedimentisphaerales bacterium]HRS11362.1 MFS transporter [Sedimentisphaerales bacterium]HRV47934.1 MFS transporter [Sedimentisphaerales bacterium]
MNKAADVKDHGGSLAGCADLTGDERERSNLPHVVRALRHRNYRLFFGGQLISLVGTWMQSVAQSWLVYRLTGSAALLGFVGFASQIPVFLLAPLGGSVADRHRRRHVLIATQTAAMLVAFVLAGLTLTGRVQVWHIVVLATFLGVINAVDIPTRQAFAVDIVGRDDLINAIALNSSMVNGARIVGPAVAGVLVASVGEGWCFLVNAVSFLAVIAGLLMMNMTARTSVPLPGSALGSILEGFRYVRRTRPVRALLLLLGLVSLMGMPYAVLMPVFADQILHGGPRGLGLLMGASGTGALIGALVLAARQGIRGLSHWIARAAAGFGVSLILFSLSRSFWLSAALLVPAGFSMMIEMAASNTMIQSLIPDVLRGRVMAVYSMMFMGMAPFGALLAGALAHRIGAPPTVMVGGAACIVGAALFRWHLPALKDETRQMIVALQVAGGEPAEEMTGQASVVAPREP